MKVAMSTVSPRIFFNDDFVVIFVPSLVNFLYLSVFISFYCELLKVNWIQVEFKWNKIINSLNQTFKWQA